MSPQRSRLRIEGSAEIGREIEPKSLPGEVWRERAQERAPALAHERRGPEGLDVEETDFDIAAWFAMEDDEESRERCIAECWYG